MKNILIILSLLSIGFSGSAQTKTELLEKSQKKAKTETSYIVSHMKMDTEYESFLEATLTTKFLYTATYAKNNTDLEFKQGVYKKSHEWTFNELKKKFSKSETKQILTLLKTKRDHDKKVKGKV